ncbi:hypothetical protein niasHT_033143 [Heterodera trifolii]|uniref:Uncharacterized protein n=1 Tax=Heterodera trifolii TaxID=157864 RepID=A0ABD2HVU0_9BILA
MQIVKFDGNPLPIPRNPLPNKVIGFRLIQITYIDQNAVAFLRRFHRIFAVCSTELYITTGNVRILDYFLLNIWPMFRNSIRLMLLNTIDLRRLRQLALQFSTIVHHFAVSLSMTSFCPLFRLMKVPMRRMAKRWQNGCSRLVRMVCRSLLDAFSRANLIAVPMFVICCAILLKWQNQSTDPNYGTLKNLDANIFTKNAPAKPAAAPKAGPAPHGGGGQALTPTTDPNYGTLQNLDAEIFTKNAPAKPAAAPKAGPAPHGGGGQALTPTTDPNYGTLQNLDAEIFVKK